MMTRGRVALPLQLQDLERSEAFEREVLDYEFRLALDLLKSKEKYLRHHCGFLAL